VRVLSLASYLCDKSRSLGRKVSISVSPERVSLEIGDASVAFKPLCAGFSLVETFIEGDYEVPEVLSGLRDRDVIDMGASVGDTALYFVLNGARKVIAVEPLPNVAKCAEENVSISGLAERAKIANAILGKSGRLRVPCNYGIEASVDFLPLSQQCAGGTCEVQP